jgi:addiction module HigA family antidote
VTTYPDEVLVGDFLKPMGMSAQALAVRMKVPATRISRIIHERRSVSFDPALRLGRFFGMSAEFCAKTESSAP